MKKLISVLLTCILLISSSSICTFSKNSKQKMKLSYTEILDLMIGKNTTIKLTNPKGKVKWSVEYDNVIKIVKKKGKKNQSIKIKAISLGQSYVYARVNGKKFKCYVNVVDEYFSFRSLKKVYIDKGEAYKMQFKAELLEEACINKQKKIKVYFSLPREEPSLQRLKKGKWKKVPLYSPPYSATNASWDPITWTDKYDFTNIILKLSNSSVIGDKAGEYRFAFEIEIYIWNEDDDPKLLPNPIKRTYYAYFKIKDYEFTL